MIDWENSKFEDFEIEVLGDGVIRSGESLVFPVNVYEKDKALVFSHQVTIRAEFYIQLKGREYWQKELMDIICNRTRDEIKKRSKKEDVSIDDKIDLIKMDRQSL